MADQDTNLLNEDDEEIMGVLVDIFVKWATERPEAARQGSKGILPVLLSVTKQGEDLSADQVDDDRILEFTQQIISHVEDGRIEAAVSCIEEFFTGNTPNPQNHE
jgi:hypothetical protein